MDKNKPLMGRPTAYTQDIADEICARIMGGEGLIAICRDDHMPSRQTVHTWLSKDEHKHFLDKYEKARNEQAEFLVEEIIDIADNSIDDYKQVEVNGQVFDKANTEHIQRSRLRVDTRKWYASKVLPKKYGEKLDVTTDGKPLNFTFDSTFKNAVTPDSEKDNIE